MSEVEGTGPPPSGWYADPSGESGRLRYWDGEQWTDRYQSTEVGYTVDGVDGPPLPLTTVRRWAIAGLVFVAVAEAFAIVANLNRISLDQTFLDGGLVTLADAQRADDLDLAATIVLLGGYVVAAATFITWFRRAYGNLPRLGFRRLRYEPGWAIGAWFVPILNLFRPKQIANDIYRASTPGLAPTTRYWETQPITALLGWWWGLFLISGTGVQFPSRVDSDDFAAARAGLTAVEDERNVLIFMAIGNAVAIAGAIVAIKLVIDLSRRQEEAIRVKEMEGMAIEA